MKYGLYDILRPIITVLMKLLFRIEIVGSENIPKDGGVVLAGNHKSNFDCVLLISSVKRMIRFIAKKELIEGRLGFFFKKMGLIPVDRNKKNKKAISEAIEVLRNGGVVGIFPEGTLNKTEYITMPFKMGAVKMALESECQIVPFAIVHDYRLFRKGVKIIFGKAYNIKDKNDLKKENITLMNKVIRLLKSGNN